LQPVRDTKEPKGVTRMTTQTAKQGLATYAEVREYLNVSKATLRRLIENKEIKVIYLNTAPRIEWQEVENFIATRRQS